MGLEKSPLSPPSYVTAGLGVLLGSVLGLRVRVEGGVGKEPALTALVRYGRAGVRVGARVAG